MINFSRKITRLQNIHILKIVGNHFGAVDSVGVGEDSKCRLNLRVPFWRLSENIIQILHIKFTM
jgi:hypothetical protein